MDAPDPPALADQGTWLAVHCDQRLWDAPWSRRLMSTDGDPVGHSSAADTALQDVLQRIRVIGGLEVPRSHGTSAPPHRCRARERSQTRRWRKLHLHPAAGTRD